MEWVVCRRDWITITMDEIVRAANVGARRSSTGSFASELVELIKVSAIKYFWHL